MDQLEATSPRLAVMTIHPTHSKVRNEWGTQGLARWQFQLHIHTPGFARRVHRSFDFAQDKSRLPLARAWQLNRSTPTLVLVPRPAQRSRKGIREIVDVFRGCQRSHQADAEDLSGERTEAASDFNAVLFE